MENSLERDLARLHGAFKGAPKSERAALFPRAPENHDAVCSQALPCQHCGAIVALLIYAPGAVDAASFDAYASAMQMCYSDLNVATWIVGPAVGEGPMGQRPADTLRVWPARGGITRMDPDQFGALIDARTREHCSAHFDAALRPPELRHDQ
ncbi:MAG: hypothetical protein V4582_14145 [Pseudomonadota bacterium]